MGLAHLVPDDARCYRSPQGKTKTVLASAATASSATASRYGSPDKRPETSANIHRTGIDPKRRHSFLQGLESAIDSLGCPYWSQRLTQVHQEIAAGNPVWLALKIPRNLVRYACNWSERAKRPVHSISCCITLPVTTVKLRWRWPIIWRRCWNRRY